MRQSFECCRKKIIGKPCEGEPHARFDVAGDGIVNNAPSLDPTSHGFLPPSVANHKSVSVMVWMKEVV